MEKMTALLLFLLVLIGGPTLNTVQGLVPYGRTLWDMLMTMPSDDPFRIMEQSPFPIPPTTKSSLLDTSGLALAQVDWKETPTAHLIFIDVPGVKKERLKIEVEGNRVMRISGERKTEVEGDDGEEGEKWHRAERVSGKFWRQFRLPASADVDSIKAHLEDGVLKIRVSKLGGEGPKLINVMEQHKGNAANNNNNKNNNNNNNNNKGEDIKPVKADL
ncbi:putative small heat shock protein HSP20 [Dioscorea sansibarensis]